MRYGRKGFDFGDFEITKREILASISIIAVMILIGILISSKISEYQMDKNEKYNKAVKIESQEMFQYGMDTNVGNAFIYGDLKAVDTVTYPEIGGEYMYVEKVKERYTRHQCNSMTTTNGQSPFLSVFMYLGETEEYKDELAMIIEEFLNQRILGMKNEVGVYVTQAFPKLLYVLEEDNIYENSKYWYLTELAAKCTAKRLVPDYISEKMMKKYKEGNCFPCMGERKLQPRINRLNLVA